MSSVATRLQPPLPPTTLPVHPLYVLAYAWASEQMREKERRREEAVRRLALEHVRRIARSN